MTCPGSRRAHSTNSLCSGFPSVSGTRLDCVLVLSLADTLFSGCDFLNRRSPGG